MDLLAVDPSGAQATVRAWNYSVLPSDLADDRNGPNSKACGGTSKGSRIDGVPFDKRFTCECTETWEGENCEKAFECPPNTKQTAGQAKCRPFNLIVGNRSKASVQMKHVYNLTEGSTALKAIVGVGDTFVIPTLEVLPGGTYSDPTSTEITYSVRTVGYNTRSVGIDSEFVEYYGDVADCTSGLHRWLTTNLDSAMAGDIVLSSKNGGSVTLASVQFPRAKSEWVQVVLFRADTDSVRVRLNWTHCVSRHGPDKPPLNSTGCDSSAGATRPAKATRATRATRATKDTRPRNPTTPTTVKRHTRPTTPTTPKRHTGPTRAASEYTVCADTAGSKNYGCETCSRT